ncbi:hypothetical protein [Halorussus aquaticus]|uniref:Uncharacterized protein n=1 Tax=Halorussus aquaticus TaxID=2953748 RepID=A0ABD5PXX7_9EURY|nr:hypothetical protein [Halorussus aquaticus]
MSKSDRNCTAQHRHRAPFLPARSGTRPSRPILRRCRQALL